MYFVLEDIQKLDCYKATLQVDQIILCFPENMIYPESKTQLDLYTCAQGHLPHPPDSMDLSVCFQGKVNSLGRFLYYRQITIKQSTHVDLVAWVWHTCLSLTQLLNQLQKYDISYLLLSYTQMALLYLLSRSFLIPFFYRVYFQSLTVCCG